MNGFVADEHIPFGSISLLRESGYRVVSIREDYQSADDEIILELAENEKMVVVTNDRDFGELVYREKVKFSAGLIYCRLGKITATEIGELILYNVREYGAEFEGKFTVLSRGRFRQRDL